MSSGAVRVRKVYATLAFVLHATMFIIEYIYIIKDNIPSECYTVFDMQIFIDVHFVESLINTVFCLEFTVSNKICNLINLQLVWSVDTSELL